MADFNSESDADKTEEPSAQRLEDFRQEGQVAQSRELTSLFVLLACMSTLYLAGPNIISEFMGAVRRLLSECATTTLTPESAGKIMEQVLSICGKIVLPIALAGFVAGVLGSIVQIGFNLTFTPLEPQFDRINPLNGFQRLFSLGSLVEGLKAVLKLVAVVFVTYLMVKNEILASPAITDMESFQLAGYMTSTAFRLIGGVGLALFVVAALDFAYQKFRYHKSLMMTKQEARQEHKQKEGDPLLKARMRSMQREAARKRMMQAVPKADVIVTNPTHIAVALKYDSDKMAAPRVVAKGADHLAQRIKELGKKNGVPLVENVPLARALHKSVKVGGSVPRALYQAVAEVLAYVYRLRGRTSWKKE
jgi:flagellar biosynthetic protein FlhB